MSDASQENERQQIMPNVSLRDRKSIQESLPQIDLSPLSLEKCCKTIISWSSTQQNLSEQSCQLKQKIISVLNMIVEIILLRWKKMNQRSTPKN